MGPEVTKEIITHSSTGKEIELYALNTAHGKVFALDKYTLEELIAYEKSVNEGFENYRRTSWAFHNLSGFQKFILSLNRFGETLLKMWSK